MRSTSGRTVESSGCSDWPRFGLAGSAAPRRDAPPPPGRRSTASSVRVTARRGRWWEIGGNWQWGKLGSGKLGSGGNWGQSRIWGSESNFGGLDLANLAFGEIRL